MNKKRHSDRRGLGRKREIRILQHNMQRSKTIPYEIRTQMDADGDDIILMQEPYSVDGKIPGFGTGVAIACRGSKHDPPMAAVGIKSETLTPLEVAELCTTHCSCVQIGDGETEVYAASLYFPPTGNIEVGVQQLEKVLRCLRGKRTIIGLDANAKSPLWCSRSTDDRGEALEAVIAQYGLHVLNQPGQPYTFEITRGRSNIDVTMASPEAILLVKGWRIREDGTSSDHLETLLDFGTRSTTPQLQERRYNTRKANWEVFQ